MRLDGNPASRGEEIADVEVAGRRPGGRMTLRDSRVCSLCGMKSDHIFKMQFRGKSPTRQQLLPRSPTALARFLQPIAGGISGERSPCDETKRRVDGGGREKGSGGSGGMSQVKVSDRTWKGYEAGLIPEKTGGKLMHRRRAPLRDSRLADGNIIMAYIRTAIFCHVL